MKMKVPASESVQVRPTLFSIPVNNIHWVKSNPIKDFKIVIVNG